jgi:integrase
MGSTFPEETAMKLTDTIIAGLALPADKSEAFFWDDSLPGFAVRLRASGARTFAVQYRVAGRQRRESLGDTRKIKLEQARAIARKRFAAVELGGDPAADRAKVKADALAVKQTLKATIPRYLAAKKGTLRASSYAAAERYLTVHWQALHAKPLATIKRADIATITSEITAERGRVSAARARSNLSALFGWAVKMGLVETNPVINSFNPEEDIESRDRTLSDDELRQVWLACRDDPFGRITRLLILFGCRRSELGDLRWSEVDLDTGALLIPGVRTKSKKPLALTLPPAALDILREAPRRDGQEFVFGARRGYCAWSYSMATLGTRIAAANGRPLAAWTLHDLRRTMRSGLGALGVPPHIAEMVIGHYQGGIVAVYDRHKYTGEIKLALERWAGRVADIVADRPSETTNVTPLRRAQ